MAKKRKKSKKSPNMARSHRPLTFPKPDSSNMLFGDVQYIADVDWSQYVSRVERLIRLHQDVWVRHVMNLAQNVFQVAPIIFLQWALLDPQQNQYQAKDQHLNDMADAIRTFYLERKAEREGSHTWVDLFDEFLAVIPKIEVSYNWAPYTTVRREEIRKADGSAAFKACSKYEVADPKEPALPDGIPAFVNIRVPVNQMKIWGLDDIMNVLGRIVREAIENCPSKEEAPNMMTTIPPQREFLMHARPPVFKKDLLRYKLYTKKYLNFREIAFWEAQKDRGVKCFTRDLPSKIKISQTKETSVYESVKRIYEAIHLKPFPRSRRRRLDAPAEGISEYVCLVHTGSLICPESCPSLKRWVNEIERTLPTEASGSGPPPESPEPENRGRRIKPVHPEYDGPSLSKRV